MEILFVVYMVVMIAIMIPSAIYHARGWWSRVHDAFIGIYPYEDE